MTITACEVMTSWWHIDHVHIYLLFLHDPTASAKALCFRAVHPPNSSVRSSRRILLPQYVVNGLSNLDETHREHSLAPSDDLIRCWRSKVKGEGHRQPSRWRRHIHLHCGSEISSSIFWFLCYFYICIREPV